MFPVCTTDRWTMRNHLVAAIFLALIGLHAMGASTLAAWSADEGDQLLFEQTRIDVGPVSDAETVKRAFKFVNNSGRIISLAVGHCSFCPEPETDKKQYLPGESGVVVLELVTMGKYGDVSANADVGVAGVKGRGVNIVLAAQVRPTVRVEPPGINLPEIVRMKGATEIITITGRGKDFAVTGVESLSPWLDVVASPGKKVKDLDEECTVHEITLKVKPGVPLGAFNGSISIRTTDSRKAVVGFSIEGRVVGDMFARPDHVTLKAMRPESVFTAEFEVLTHSGDPLLPGMIELAVKPLYGVASCVIDAVPGDEVGVMHITVSGLLPPRAMPTFDMPVAITHSVTREVLMVPIRLNPRNDVPKSSGGSRQKP